MKAWILPRYVIRSALFAMMGAVVGLWLLQMVFAYLSELENLSDTYTFKDALAYIMYRSPYFLVQFIPTGALLGAVIGLGLLAGNSELVVMRAGGISVYRIIGYAMLPAFLFVMISLAVNQFVLPTTNDKASQIANHLPNKKLFTVNGYWAVNDTEQGQEIVYISYADSDGKLGATKRYYLDKGANLTGATRAGSGVFHEQVGDDYQWQLTDVAQLTVGDTGVSRSFDMHKTLSLPLAPSDVHLLTKEAEDLSLTDLLTHKQLMTHQGRRSLRHEVAFWQKLLSPFAVLSLVLVASSFVFGLLRSQGLGLRIVMALLTGLLFSYLTDLTGFVALATGFSPFFMALLPIIISAGVGIYLLQRRQ
ncbi:LPS export ABC transporter permease LptG [Moraxella bovis]|uniref:LPS export ABC transporter permease LptG n=1 Tax=Moraxella bovis TaxID=476 RepID=UPI002225FCB8|nr:LPS export ABC transporter permease LptG [Moraxella bovis]UYZ68810.1 LPS export ABC transporter permease LptG [Moraxella bovis]UYZ71187.1 LPS export ABC transporter permease LptG [Moraxella bovis]UZA27158.1 LPS export ABC transporter permease LptG [Moraxella bovis]WAJ73344.1 LPS export ABC transporter permease LptG [Moraxella bovis]